MLILLITLLFIVNRFLPELWSSWNENHPESRILTTYKAPNRVEFSKSEINELVAGTKNKIYWEMFWFKEWNEKSFKELEEKNNVIFSITRKGFLPYCRVFLNELKTIFEFHKINGKWYFLTLNNLLKDPHSFDVFKEPDMLEINVASVKSGKKILLFGAFNHKKIKETDQLIKDMVSREKFYSLLNSKVPCETVKIKFGNYNPLYSTRYFYIEGFPYLGDITVDLITGENLGYGLELLDAKHTNRVNAKNLIDKNGKWFVVPTTRKRD